MARTLPLGRGAGAPQLTPQSPRKPSKLFASASKYFTPAPTVPVRSRTTLRQSARFRGLARHLQTSTASVTIQIPSRTNSYLRWCERGLWAIGILLSACWAGTWLEGRVYQAYQNDQLNRSLQAASVPAGAGTTGMGSGILGRLEIPRLGLSVLVLNGVDAATLILGAGRLPGASGAGDGNLVIAAHRDTYFRPLRDIRKNDRILVTTTDGIYPYVVQWTAVVKQSDTGALANTRDPSLTLVTCYPFQYIGPAPERFVVRARLVAASKPVPQPGVPAPEGRPSPFLAHRKVVRAAEEAVAAPEADASEEAPAAPLGASAVETNLSAGAPGSRGIGRLNPASLFKRIAQAAHRNKTEAAQALPPANEPENQ